MADVFISYSRRDINFVRKLYDALRAANRDSWVDWEGIPPTAEWLKEVFAGIESADTFICVLSPDFVTSSTCAMEVAHAIECKKRLMPIVYRDVNSSEVNPRVAELNWLLFRDGDDFDESFKKLVEALDTDLDYIHNSTRLLIRAREWENNSKNSAEWQTSLETSVKSPFVFLLMSIRQVRFAFQQNSSFTLRGSDLTSAERWLVEAADKRPGPTILQVQYIATSRRIATIRQRIVSGAVSVALIVTLILSFISFTQYQGAQRETLIAQNNARIAVAQANIARSRALAAQSNYYLLQNRVDLAMLLSVKAYQTNDNYDTRDSLLTALEYSPHMSTILSHDPQSVHSAPVNSLAFSTDGRTLISARDRYGDISLWDMATKKPRSLSLPGGNGVSSMVISPDGKLFASANPEGIWLWDIKKGAIIAQLEGKDSTKTLAFSPDGRYLASGDCGQYIPLPWPNSGNRTDYCAQGRILLWDIASRQLARPPLLDNTGQVCRLVFSPDGTSLASRSCDRNDSASNFIANDCTQGQVLLWDMTKDNPVGQPLTNSQDEVSDIVFSPKGRILASGGGNGTILLWDVQSRQLATQPLFGHTGHVCRMAFSPDGMLLASGGEDRTVRLWNAETGKSVGEPLAGHQAGVMSIAFSPDGQQLASGDSSYAIILWDMRSYIAVSQLLGDTNQLQAQSGTSSGLGYSSAIAFNPKSNMLAVGYSNGKIVLWDMKTRLSVGTLEIAIDDPNYAGESLAFSPDGKLLASGNYNYAFESGSNKVLLWDMTTRKVIADFRYANQHQTNMRSLAFSPNGHILVGSGEVSGTDSRGIATFTTTMVFWDVATGKIIHQITRKGLQISNVTFSPDGQLVASGNENEIAFWNVATGQSEGQALYAKETSTYIDSVAFSPDGHTLASGESDGTVVLWNVSTREQIGQPLPVHQDVTTETDNTVTVAFNPDGKTLAAGDLMTVILWNVATHGQIVHPFRHPDQVSSVIFSPDGQLLISGDLDGFVTLWNINLQSWLTRACSVANRNFTVEEWNQFVPNEPYQHVCPGLPVTSS